MFPIEILAHIIKISYNDIALNIILAFNIRKVDEFIDMLVEKHVNERITTYTIHHIVHYRYGPAVISDYVKMWCYRGKIHRGIENSHVLGNDYSRNPGPAIEYSNGKKEWYQNGLYHRLDGPAIIYTDGEEWYINGKLHREDGPAVIFPHGKKWYQNGLLHRNIMGNEISRGPAIEYSDGKKEWYYHGKLHRMDGPAIEYPNGMGDWYLHDILIAKNRW